jgi:5'-nucleotidase
LVRVLTQTINDVDTVLSVKILVTNDDGIDSVGLHVLARSLLDLGEVTIAAPDQEYSGAGAAIGALHISRPEVHQVNIDKIEKSWAISGPPALCVMYATRGVLEDSFDIVVSGINPGSNVGNSVYHSGTLGAAFTARNAGITGVAVSQAVTGWGIEGQGIEEVLKNQIWETAAEVARTAVSSIISEPPKQPKVLNINVPNKPLTELKGWRYTEVAKRSTRSMTEAKLELKPGHENSYRVQMSWSDPEIQPIETDVGAVMNDYVSLTWINSLEATRPSDTEMVDESLNGLFG